MKNSLVIPAAIIIGGIIVAGALYLSMPKRSEELTSNTALLRPVNANDHILGNPAAPVMIIEYSDFECTYCREFHEVLHQIIANEGASGKVAWVFREFPLTEIHPNSLPHARAAECVADTMGNDAFWKFTDSLFTHQPVDPKNYGALVSALGVPNTSFADCFTEAEKKVDARITADRQNALDIGAEGTPYSIILVNGKSPVVIKGGYPYGAVQQLVDEALQNTK